MVFPYISGLPASSCFVRIEIETISRNSAGEPRLEVDTSAVVVQ